ncbi:hypothetical protein [Segniliparus rugosus]|nr:hypothetical protein [Segniliparus rugosus]
MPDTSDFRRRLKRDIEQVEKELRAEVSVDVDLNAKGVKAEFEALLAELRAQGAKGVGIDVDKNGAAAKSAGIVGTAFSRALRPVRDLTDALRYHQTLLRQQDRSLSASAAWVKTWAVAVREARESLKSHARKLRELDMSLAANTARFKSWGRSIVNATALAGSGLKRLSQDGGGLALLSGRLSAFGKASRGAVPSVGRLGTAFAGVGPTVIALAAALALLPPVLALVSGALVSLPAVAAGVLAPLAAVALGMDGIKKAAMDSGLLEFDKKGKPHFGRMFEPVQSAVSSVFSSKLTSVFSDIGKLMPTLAASLPKVADGLSGMAKAFVDTLTSGPGLAKVDNIVSSIGESLSRSAPGVASFTNGLLTLAEKVAGKFPNLADAFNRAGEAFDNWVDKITAAGSDGKSPLDNALHNFWGALKSIGGLLKDLAKQGFDFLSDPKSGDKIEKFVSGLRFIIEKGLPALGHFFVDLTDFLTEFNKAADRVSSLSGIFGGGDSKEGKKNRYGIVKGDPNSWEGEYGLFGNEKGDLAWDGTKAQQYWNNVKQWAADAWAAIANAASSMWNQFKSDVSSSTAEIASWAKHIFVDAPLALVSGMWSQLTSDVSATMSDLGSRISSAWDSVWSSLSGGASSAWASVTSTVSGAVSTIGTFFASIPAELSSAWSSAVSIASGVWDGVVSAVQSAVSSLAGVVSSGAGTIVSEIGTWPGRFVSALGDLGSLLSSAGAQMVQGFVNGIKSMAGAVASAAVGVASDAKNAVTSFLGIHSPSKVFHEIGQNVGQGFANGLDDEQQHVVDTAKAIMQAAKDVFGDKANVAFNFNFGGLQQALAPVADSVSSISGGVRDSMSGARGVRRHLDRAAKAQLDDISAQRKELQLQQAQLQLELDSTKDKAKRAEIKKQMDQIKIQKDQLSIQAQQVKTAGTYTEEIGNAYDLNKEMAGTMMKAAKVPWDFAEANGKQFLSDIGVGGNGVLSNLLDQGFQLGSQYVFNVSNIDQAMQVQRNQQNKDAMQYAGR